MREYSSTDLANNTGDVLAAAASEDVKITRHGKPRFVIMSRERFERLVSRGDTRRAVRVDEMSDEERDELIAALDQELGDD